MTFSRFSMKTKVLVVASLVVTLFAAILIGISRHAMLSINAGSYHALKAKSLEMRKEEMKSEVAVALGIIQGIYDETRATGGDMEDAKSRVIRALRPIRFFPDKSGYFFIHALQGERITAVLIPVKTELEGHDVTDIKDTNGTYFMQELRKQARAGGGFVDYLFPKKPGGAPAPKVACVGYFAPWGWQIGTGVYTDDLEAAAAKINAAGVQHADRQFYSMCAIGLLVLVTIVAALWFGLGLLLKPLQSIGTVVKELAQGDGDLTRRLPVVSTDEVGELSKALNVFIGKLQEIMLEVAMESHEVGDCSEKVSVISRGLAAEFDVLTEKSSSVATASGQMAATSNQIASSCVDAAEGAEAASDKASTGAAVLQKTLESMRRLAEKVTASAHTVEGLGSRSDEIGAIISTIEDIADQTNLLALNAAIEAARAGEQGRGFAVVADEVRALAERTAKATREIARMIKSIQEETKAAVAVMEEGVREVEVGSEEAARSGAALQEILDQVERVTSQVNQIATAAEEQSAATMEITANVQQLNEILQQGSHSLKDAAGMAQGMKELSDELNLQIGRFRLS